MKTQRSDALKLYSELAQTHPILTHEQEMELSKRWKESQDKAALDRLVLSNVRAVFKIAGEFSNQHLAYGDLVQEGMLGLLRAVDRYDADRGTRFLSYAAWWIRAYIRDYLLRTRSLVRVGTTQRQRTVYSRMGRARMTAAREGLHGEARMERIVEIIGVDRGTVEDTMARLAGYDISLDAPVGPWGDSAPRSSFLPDPAASPEVIVGETEEDSLQRTQLREALRSLPHREQLIIQRRHLSVSPDTLQEVGELLGVSRERVRQLEVRALRRMKEWLEAEGHLQQVA